MVFACVEATKRNRGARHGGRDVAEALYRVLPAAIPSLNGDVVGNALAYMEFLGHKPSLTYGEGVEGFMVSRVGCGCVHECHVVPNL